MLGEGKLGMLRLITLSASLLLSRMHLITSADLPGRRVGRQVRQDEIYEGVSIESYHLRKISDVILLENYHLGFLFFYFIIIVSF